MPARWWPSCACWHVVRTARHVGAESFKLVFPMEDLHIAGGNTETVDGLHVPGASAFGCSIGPVVDALLFACDNRGFEIGGFNAINVDGAVAAGLLAEDGEAWHHRNQGGGGFGYDRAGVHDFSAQRGKRLAIAGLVGGLGGEQGFETGEELGG